MEEILHHLKDENLVNIGVNYLSAGAGFLPSTVGTPPKFNMELENDGFHLEFPFPEADFQASC